MHKADGGVDLRDGGESDEVVLRLQEATRRVEQHSGCYMPSSYRGDVADRGFFESCSGFLPGAMGLTSSTASWMRKMILWRSTAVVAERLVSKSSRCSARILLN